MSELFRLARFAPAELPASVTVTVVLVSAFRSASPFAVSLTCSVTVPAETFLPSVPIVSRRVPVAGGVRDERRQLDDAGASRPQPRARAA